MPALPLPSPLGDCEALDDGAGRSRLGGARPFVNKLSILRAMERLGYPASTEEIQEELEELLPLAAIEFHLSTLAAVRLVRPLYGPEIYFEYLRRGAVPSALTESKRTEP